MVRESSDEKLLKLIEGKAEARRMPNPGIKLKAPGTQPKLPLGVNVKIGLDSLIKGVFFIGIVLTIVFLYRIFSQVKMDSAGLLFPDVRDAGPGGKAGQADMPGYLPLEEYLDPLDQRNIFLAPGTAQISGESESAVLSSLQSAALTELKVVGIVWSDNPEVMIEDQIDTRTYLYKKGDLVGKKQQYRIKEVRRASVLLEIEAGGKMKEFEIR